MPFSTINGVVTLIGILLHNNYQGFAWSAMTEKLQNGILVGRPSGGLGFLINKNIKAKVSICDFMSNCRGVSIMITFPNGFTLLMIIVYLPYFKQGTDYMDNSLECLGFNESSVEQNKADGLIIAGDMNIEGRTENVGRRLFHPMAQDLRIKCCDE